MKNDDKEKLKALPPVEHDEVDPDGAVATIVEDSDDEAPASTPVTSVFVAPAPVVTAPVVTTAVEPAPAAEKKKIVRKKTDA